MTRARLLLTLAGFGFALAGVLRDDQVLTWIAIAALAGAVTLRIIARRRGRPG